MDELFKKKFPKTGKLPKSPLGNASKPPPLLGTFFLFGNFFLKSSSI